MTGCAVNRPSTSASDKRTVRCPALNVIATAYYVDDSQYPQVARSGAPIRVQRIYWRNMAALFASVRKMSQDTDVRLVVFSNATPQPAERKVLDRLDVEIREVPFAHQPPRGYFPQFGGAFYLFDAMQTLSQELRPTDTAFLVDPDCLLVNRPEPLYELLRRDRTVSVSFPYAPQMVASTNMSRILMRDIFSEVTGEEVAEPPTWFAGEFYGFTGETLSQAAAAIDEIWAASMERYRQGQVRLNTQEHMTNFVLWRMGLRTGNANHLVRRIWTSPAYNNVGRGGPDSEMSLVVWHLPAEKRRGLVRLYHDAADPGSLFWALEGDAWRRYVAATVGIRASRQRRLLDRALRAAMRLKRRVQTARQVVTAGLR